MRLVLDTNVAISGLLWRGVPGRLIEAAESGQVVIVASTQLLAELRGVLQRENFQRRLQSRGVLLDDLLDGYLELVDIVPPAELSATIASDPTDDIVLAAALAGGADLIVSGDAHVLNLKRYRDIEIVRPAAALDYVLRGGKP